MSTINNYFDEIPSGWHFKKLKYICAINQDVLDSNTDPNLEFDYVDIGSVEYNNGIVNRTRMYFEDSPSRARRKVKAGDVIISTVRTYLKAITPISESDKDIIVSTGFAVIHSQKVTKSYMAYLLTSKPFVETIVSESVGVSYPAINPNKIATIKIPLPESEDLQGAIANFLDKKTESIRTQIRKIEKMIKLLKEKKMVLIINTITKGLNPDAPMKDSSVEWIGEIPDHWDVKKLKYKFNIYSGATPKSDNADYWEGDITWITPADYSSDDIYITSSKRRITQAGVDSCATKIIPVNSIVLSNRAPIGTVAIAGIELCTNQGCKSLVPINNINSKYIYYFLYAQNSTLNMLGRGTTFLELSTYDLGSFKAPLPGLSEQNDIVNYLDTQIDGINNVINKNGKLIQKLAEYQEALISAAVTGKIDVRGE